MIILFTAMLSVEIALLFIALAWICYSLRNDREVMGNEKLMAFHSILLLIILACAVMFAQTYAKL
jgi:hypothetical protein